MKKIAAISYHGYKDPLCAHLFLTYLREMMDTSSENYHLSLITLESPEFQMDPKEMTREKLKLAGSQINWVPIMQRRGRFILIKKCLEFVSIGFRLVQLRLSGSLNFIVGFTTYSGILAFLLSRFLMTNLVILNFEPHSEYLADFGTISRSSLRFKLLSRLERVVMKFSEHIAYPTKSGHKLGCDLATKGDPRYLPTAIQFTQPNYSDRDRMRSQYHISDYTVLVYAGKFDGIYFSVREFAKIVNTILLRNTNFYFLIATSDPVINVKDGFHQVNETDRWQVIGGMPLPKLKDILVGCDIGVLFLPQLPSQVYRSPVKTALYWSQGLPVLLNGVIGDDTDLALEQDIGYVIEDVHAISDNDHVRMRHLVSCNRDRCREISGKYREIGPTVRYLDNVMANKITLSSQEG